MIPQRVIIAVMGFFSTVVVFTMRSCISIVITEIVTPLNNTRNISNESIICPADSLSVKSNTVSDMVSGFVYSKGKYFDDSPINRTGYDIIGRKSNKDGYFRHSS